MIHFLSKGQRLMEKKSVEKYYRVWKIKYKNSLLRLPTRSEKACPNDVCLCLDPMRGCELEHQQPSCSVRFSLKPLEFIINSLSHFSFWRFVSGVNQSCFPAQLAAAEPGPVLVARRTDRRLRQVPGKWCQSSCGLTPPALGTARLEVLQNLCFSVLAQWSFYWNKKIWSSWKRRRCC